jgi:hypothetical protein
MNNNRKDKMMVKISNITFKKIGTQIDGEHYQPVDVIADARFIVDDKYVCFGTIYGRETFDYDGEHSGYHEWMGWKEEEGDADPIHKTTLFEISEIVTSIFRQHELEKEVEEYKKQKEEDEKLIKEMNPFKELEPKNPWKEIEVAGLKIKIAPLKDLQS